MALFPPPARRVPWGEIDAVLLDVGGTVVAIDMDLVSRRLRELGRSVSAEALARAEAAARPELSRRLELGEGARRDGFLLLLEAALRRALPGEGDPADLAERLAPLLRRTGHADELWSRPVAGARDALDQLARLGLPVIAVSNSDGTAERSLERAGLRAGFRAVVDSHLIGAEKPDPAIFRAALAIAGVPPERAVHVGDLHAVDAAGARRAGVHAVLLDPFGDWDGVDCERARDVAEVAERLRRARGS